MERAFSVYGYWPFTQERWGNTFEATSARAAEDLAQMQAAERDAVLRVAGVFEGEVASVDWEYTLYVDPRDVRNDITVCVPELEVVTWTVLGLAEDPHDKRWNERTGGSRFCDQILADSPLAAEDVAVNKIRGEGGQLLVCAVFAGKVQRADARYAKFANVDVQVA